MEMENAKDNSLENDNIPDVYDEENSKYHPGRLIVVKNRPHIPGEITIFSKNLRKLSMYGMALVMAIPFLPKNYNFTAEKFARDFETSKQDVKKGIRELERHKFLIRKQVKNSEGKTEIRVSLEHGLVYKT